MKAILYDAAGVLRIADATAPQPGPGEVRIRVAACGINRADLLQKAGHYPPPAGASDILGLECAGVIDAVGKNVTAWKIGDKVCALLSGGGYAEYCCVDARHCLPAPQGLSLTEAAALPEVFATAWLNLYREAALAPGERALLLAGASGVGTAAIQLCRLFGNPCVVSVGTSAKLSACLTLGAENGWLHGSPAPDELQKNGVDVILDPVGGQALADHLNWLRIDGRLVLIGQMGGRHAEIDVARFLARRLRLIGSTLRSRRADQKAALIADLAAQVWPHFDSGQLRPIIDSIFPWTEAEAAHTHMAANRNIGKIVLEVGAAI